MKVLTYIRKCNAEQLAQLLSSIWWSDREYDIVFRLPHSVIQDHANIMQNEFFNEQIPELIEFDDKKYINTKTRQLQ